DGCRLVGWVERPPKLWRRRPRNPSQLPMMGFAFTVCCLSRVPLGRSTHPTDRVARRAESGRAHGLSRQWRRFFRRENRVRRNRNFASNSSRLGSSSPLVLNFLLSFFQK